MADDIPTLRRILRSARTLAVVGLSAEWHRPSFFAAKYMQEHGYRIIPVNPRYPRSSASAATRASRRSRSRSTSSTSSADRGRAADRAQAIAIGAKCLWQQIGVKNLEARSSPPSRASTS
jgi:predicted CoA-binding protein